MAELTSDSFFKAVIFNDVNTISSALAEGFNPNVIDKSGNTALIVALREKSYEVANLLISNNKTDLNKPNIAGETPIMMAAFNGSYEIVRTLIEHHQVALNHPGWTALHYASTNGHDQLVEYLLKCGAYVDPESPNRTTALMMAVRGGHIKVINLLLKNGADLSLVNSAGLSAIDFAEQNNQKDIYKSLNLIWTKVYGAAYPNKK